MRLSELILKGALQSRIRFGRGAAVSVDELIATGQTYLGEGPSHAHPVVLTNDRVSTELLLGAIASGVRLVSLPLPPRTNRADYRDLLLAAFYSGGETPIIARDDVCAQIGEGIPLQPHSMLRRRQVGRSAAGRFELVQYTSGTTGIPRDILLDDHQLGTNVEAMLSRLGPEPGDKAVSWLPLSHDMGLVGMLLTSVASGGASWTGGTETVLLDTADFLRVPSRWLSALSEFEGTFTAAPDFAYRLALRRPVGYLDLSHLRCAIIGGEVIRAATLTSFADGLAESGFTPLAFCPSYGMAEVGLGVTMTPPAVAPRTSRSETGHDVVASGYALDGYAVHVDAQRGALGRVVVDGPSIGRAPHLECPPRRLWTNDEGFLDSDGWLYVVGRVDDHVVIRGRKIFAPAIESTVCSVDEVRDGRAAVAGLDDGKTVLVVELSRARSTTVSEIARAFSAVAGAAPDHILIAPKGSLPFTSSGKLRRQDLRGLVGSMLEGPAISDQVEETQDQ